MIGIFKIFLSLSVSGSVLILVLFLLKPLFRNRVSRQWQYYVWLIVIARLLLPITSDASFVGSLFRWSDQVLASSAPGVGCGGDESMRQTPQGDIPIDDIILSQRGSRAGSGMASQDGGISKTLAPTQDGNMSRNDESLKDSNKPVTTRPLQGGNTLENTERSGWRITTSVFEYLWMLWLAGTLVLSVRKITVYQGYAKYIKAGCREVADIALLDQLAQEEVWAGVKHPVELYVNNLVSSPMLLGFFRPCIILPATDLPRDEFLCTVRHELIHYRRRDMFYKWLVQITICLHWFNPLVYLMGRELDRACELSCDEAVIRSLDEPGRRTYGDTLLHAVGTEERYGKTAVSVTLGESAKLLRERLDAIMKFHKMSKGGCCVALLLSVALAFVFAASGAYAAESAAPKVIAPSQDASLISEKVSGANAEEHREGEKSDTFADKYYGINLPQFAAAFAMLDEAAQSVWLEKIYNDKEIAFFSASLQQLEVDSSLIALFAQKAYEDGKVSFFSVLADHMSKEALESWLNKSMQDRQVSFQSVLLKELDRDWELEALEEELDRQRLAEYEGYGITRDGKVYYYQGQLVNIFLDHQSGSSFYLLDMNPNGTVNIKITRDENGVIQNVDYMTESEVEELFGDN